MRIPRGNALPRVLSFLLPFKKEFAERRRKGNKGVAQAAPTATTLQQKKLHDRSVHATTQGRHAHAARTGSALRAAATNRPGSRSRTGSCATPCQRLRAAHVVEHCSWARHMYVLMIYAPPGSSRGAGHPGITVSSAARPVLAVHAGGVRVQGRCACTERAARTQHGRAAEPCCWQAEQGRCCIRQRPHFILAAPRRPGFACSTEVEATRKEY